MAINNQGFPSYSFIMFLAFAAFGSYIWSSDPLKTARPQSQNLPAISSSSLSAIPARLWQDPFRVIYARDKGNKPRMILRLEDTPLTGAIKQYFIDKQAEELLVLGVMVSTEAIADAEERRRRRRYALVNALSESGFVPENAGQIQVGMITGQGGMRERLITPYEWFEYEAPASVTGTTKTNSHKKVLLLWLDAAHYHRKPYYHLSQLIKTLAADTAMRGNMRFAILGPAGSDGLSSLVKKSYPPVSSKQQESRPAQALSMEIKAMCQLGTAGIHILSPVATIANSRLYQTNEKTLEQRFSFANYAAGKSCLTIHRTVHRDDQLMFRMVLELWRRGIKPGHSHVVLLSERDTAFGRALPESFKQAFCGSDNRDCEAQYIHSFSYLRGIDGVAPGSNTDLGLATSKSSASKKREQAREESSVRRPVGTGQFDYLRRTADEIVLLDRKLRKQDGKGILAIGVLGSDVYDKLLILRALRSRLMGVTYFTTDLDAQFLHPAEYPWTRNLVIASSFDLKLNEALQGSVSPFRDNYQTSVFYSARLALQLTQENIASKVALPTQLDPLLFEVGRNGVVPLQPLDEENDHYANDMFAFQHTALPSQKTMQQSDLHPLANKRKLLPPLLLIIGMVILGGLALNQLLLNRLSSQTSYQLRWLLWGVVVLAVVSAVGVWCAQHEEPFIMLSGVSVWPTELINSLTLVLSLYFIFGSLRALEMNYRELGHKYLRYDPADNPDRESCDSWVCMLIGMLLVSAALVAILPRTISYDYIFLMLLVWGVVLGGWFFLLNRTLPKISLKYWMAEINGQNDEPVQKYWACYGNYGSRRHRFLRAFSIVLIFQAFVSFVFTLFGLEPPPLRGEVTRVIDSVITVGSVLGMLFLLFYMVDATRLCIVWVRGLTKKTYDWRGTRVEEYAREMNIPWPCAVHWLKLRMVAERTTEVSKLIYYPFIVIILILFSRISYFDDWGFPQSLAIITSALIAIALYTAIKLRQVAEQVRSDFIKYLNREKIVVSADTPPANKPSLAQIDELIDNVRTLRGGAFQPFLEQPLVKASLLLLGGVGFSASQFSGLM